MKVRYPPRHLRHDHGYPARDFVIKIQDPELESEDSDKPSEPALSTVNNRRPMTIPFIILTLSIPNITCHLVFDLRSPGVTLLTLLTLYVFCATGVVLRKSLVTATCLLLSEKFSVRFRISPLLCLWTQCGAEQMENIGVNWNRMITVGSRHGAPESIRSTSV